MPRLSLRQAQDRFGKTTFHQKSIPRRRRPTARWFTAQSVDQILANQHILLSTCAAWIGGQPH